LLKPGWKEVRPGNTAKEVIDQDEDILEAIIQIYSQDQEEYGGKGIQPPVQYLELFVLLRLYNDLR
jgi:hypothetical protein